MTTIVSVIEKEPKGRNWWLVTDAQGVKYSTRNMFVAALAERCREKQTPVAIGSNAGFYYRDIYVIRPEGQEATVA